MNKKEQRDSSLTSMLQFILMKRLDHPFVFSIKEFCHVVFFNYLATDKISFQTEGNVKVAVYKKRQKKNTKEITVNHERSSYVKGGED